MGGRRRSPRCTKRVFLVNQADGIGARGVTLGTACALRLRWDCCFGEKSFCFRVEGPPVSACQPGAGDMFANLSDFCVAPRLGFGRHLAHEGLNLAAAPWGASCLSPAPSFFPSASAHKGLLWALGLWVGGSWVWWSCCHSGVREETSPFCRLTAPRSFHAICVCSPRGLEPPLSHLPGRRGGRASLVPAGLWCWE